MNTTQSPKNEPVVREPTCPDCLAQRGAPTVIPKTRPTRLTKVEMVWQVTGGRREETVRHAAHKTGLLHVYMLPSAIPCSFPDRTRHKEGLIIQTLCGKIINVGRDCGRSYIIGLDDVIVYADELQRNESNLAKLKQAAKGLVPQAAKVDADVEELSKYRANIGNHIPDLSDSLRRRALSSDPRDKRVEEEIEDKSLNRDGSIRTRRINVSAALEGLCLWGATIPSSVSQDAKSLTEAIRGQLAIPTRDIPAERVLCDRVDALRRKIADRERWVEDAGRFLGAKNLKRAVGAAHLRREVVCKGNDLIFRDPNRGDIRMVVRRKGLFRFRDEKLQRRRPLTGDLQPQTAQSGAHLPPSHPVATGAP